MDLDDQLIQAKTGRRIPAMLAGRLDEADKFPAWRDELIRLLRIFDLDKYITTDVPKPDDEEQGMQWEMDRAEVKDYLLDYIGPNVLAGLQLTDRSAVHVPDPKEIFDTIAHSIEGFLAARKDRRAQESKTASAPSQPPEQSNCSAEHFHTVCLDLERERIAGRRLQQLAATSWQKLEALKQATMRSSFVLVLVDADDDAYVFDAMLDFARGPTRCGELAAASLESTVQQYLQSVDPSVAGSPIMTKAFASGEGLEGLATLLAQLGIAGRREDAQTGLAKFACGFSQARDMFDFVLVGEDKDRVNSKLMGTFRQFVENPSCVHILLACCHDNGYVRMLEEYVRNPAALRKVTLVKALQAGNEFSGLPFKTATMDQVFWNGPGTHSVGSTSAATYSRSDEGCEQGNEPRFFF